MDHYKVLGLTKNASKSEIKDAFRKLALKFHPDRHCQSPKPIRDDAARQFKHISEAYHLLTDDRKRAEYNLRSPPRRPTHGQTQTHYYTHRHSRADSKLGLDFDVAIKFLTTRAFLLNLAFACFLFGGAVVVERSADALWKMQNSGKSFEETMEAMDNHRKQKEKS